MSPLETSVQTLADALDRLEARLEDRLQDAVADTDAIDAARRQANAARTHLNEASDTLASLIDEVRAIAAASTPSPTKPEESTKSDPATEACEEMSPDALNNTPEEKAS